MASEETAAENGAPKGGRMALQKELKTKMGEGLRNRIRRAAAREGLPLGEWSRHVLLKGCEESERRAAVMDKARERVEAARAAKEKAA